MRKYTGWVAFPHSSSVRDDKAAVPDAKNLYVSAHALGPRPGDDVHVGRREETRVRRLRAGRLCVSWVRA